MSPEITAGPHTNEAGFPRGCEFCLQLTGFRAVACRRVTPVRHPARFLAKCLRIFQAVESLELNPAHLFSSFFA
jgi:hypothetical protein